MVAIAKYPYKPQWVLRLCGYLFFLKLNKVRWDVSFLHSFCKHNQ